MAFPADAARVVSSSPYGSLAGARTRSTGALRLCAERLELPSGMAFDTEGNLYVTETGLGLAGGVAGGRVYRLSRKGEVECLASGLGKPLTGVCHHQRMLFLSEGGNPGRILRVDLDTREVTTIVDGLPGGGDYHTNRPCVGEDGWLYFGQGAATNSGVVSANPEGLAWVQAQRRAHDIPGYDVVLRDVAPCGTGAFRPVGERAAPGTRLRGQLPCTAAVLRCRLDGRELQLVAWGLRNTYRLLWRGGELLALDIGMNDRGSRPIGGAPDCLFRVTPGRWYGWPDYCAGKPVTAPELRSRRRGAGAGNTELEPVEFLLSNHDELGPPAQPLFTFETHSTPTGCALVPGTNDLWLALFGDKCPVTGVEPSGAGRCLAYLDGESRTLRQVRLPELARPIDVALHPHTGELYVLDFGGYEMRSLTQVDAQPQTGRLWCLPDALAVVGQADQGQSFEPSGYPRQSG